MIKLASILQEIGDATGAVPYTHTDSGKSKYQTVEKYQFKIGEDTYIVTIYKSELDTSLPSNKDQKEGSEGIQVMFGLNTDRYSGVGDTSRTNKGVQYKVMATVTKIIKDYVEQYSKVVDISYEPVKKNAEDQARMKLYKAYVTKALPNWKYREDDYGWVYVTKPPQEKKGLFKGLFKEIGDAKITPAPFTKEKVDTSDLEDDYMYNFTIDEQNYYVLVEDTTKSGGECMFEFNIEGQDPGSKRIETNLGHQYRIMATVVAIMKDYITKENPDVYELSYVPVSTSTKDTKDDQTRREKFYKAYVQKLLPHWTYTKNGEIIVLTRPD